MIKFKPLGVITVMVLLFTGLYVAFRWQSNYPGNTNGLPPGLIHFQMESKDAKLPPQVDKQSDKESDLEIVSVAKEIAKNSKAILVTMVNDAYLPFTYSWLCNTKLMDVHNSVLIITTDEASKDKLTRDWPEIHVVAMDIGNVAGDQVYSHVGYVQIMIRRTEMLLSIVMADIEIFLFEVDCLWLTNPVPDLQQMNDFDVLVNPVAQRTGVYAGGFLYLFKTEKAKALWKELTNQMQALGERIKTLPKDKYISEGENDQMYFSGLINRKVGGELCKTRRYHDVRVKELPLSTYADGKWYSLPENERKASHPLIINNNWVLGNQKKIERAKEYGHWFIKEDFSCDMEQVKKIVY